MTSHSAAGALVAEAGRVDLRGGTSAVSLGDTVLRRLDHLRPETVQLLQAGSVLGRSFDLAVVATLTGRRAIEMAADVDEALAAGLLAASGDRLTFSHDLVREGIYAGLAGAVRSALHIDAARALAENDAEGFDVATQIERTAGGVDAEAVDWLLAGARQVRVTAPATAASFLRRAAELTERNDPRWLDIQILLAEAHVFSGNQQDGRALAEQCLDLPDLGAEPRAALIYLVGQALFLLGNLAEAADRFEQSALPGNPNRPSALADGALALLLGGDLSDAATMADRALLAAREAGDGAIEAFVLGTLSWIRSLEGDLAGGLDLGRRAVAMADATPGLEAQRNVPWLLYAEVLLWADRDAEAIVAIDRATELGERLGLVWDVPLRHLLRARAHHRGGGWDEAVAEVQAGLSHADDQGGSIAEVWLLCLLARLTVARGELDEAGRALEAAETAAAESGQGADQIAWAGALLAEARGDLTAAGRYLDLLWDGLEGRGLDYYVWDIAPDVIRVAAHNGDRTRIDRVLAAVTEISGRAQDSSAPVVAARCRGIAALDPAALLEAIGLQEERKAGARPVEQAILQSEAAAVLDHRGRTREAAALRAAAEPVLRHAHAVPPTIPGVAVRPPAPTDAAFGWDALTGREVRGDRPPRRVAEQCRDRRAAVLLTAHRRVASESRLHEAGHLLPGRAGGGGRTAAPPRSVALPMRGVPPRRTTHSWSPTGGWRRYPCLQTRWGDGSAPVARSAP